MSFHFVVDLKVSHDILMGVVDQDPEQCDTNFVGITLNLVKMQRNVLSPVSLKALTLLRKTNRPVACRGQRPWPFKLSPLPF